MPASYEQVPYPGFPFEQTHPDRLATMATLFGVDAASVECCRVLELGCGGGRNLIPMAFGLPKSKFTGIDNDATAIGRGQEEIAALGLVNIRLEAIDLLDSSDALGSYDYIIAHGLYSWAPAAVREKLFAVLSASLASRGIAYVSFNAYPGSRVRQALREMLLFHIRNENDSAKRIEMARNFLTWFEASQTGEGFGALLKAEARRLLNANPSFWYHDELEETYYPIYFHEFIAQASRYGLQFLCEAVYRDMQRPKEVDHMVRDRVLREQYLDFVTLRKFRQTLLCGNGLKVLENADAMRVRGMFVASDARKGTSAGADAQEFRDSVGAVVKTANPIAKALLECLGEAWPEALSFPTLQASIAERSGREPDTGALARVLLDLFRVAFVELRMRRPGCVKKISPTPAVSLLARYQASHGCFITTPRHTTLEPPSDFERRLIALLDGTHDRMALERELPKSDGDVTASLERLGRMGMLIS